MLQESGRKEEFMKTICFEVIGEGTIQISRAYSSGFGG